MKQRKRATHTVTFMHRAGHEPSNRNSLQDLVDKIEEYEAKDAGLTLAGKISPRVRANPTLGRLPGSQVCE